MRDDGDDQENFMFQHPFEYLPSLTPLGMTSAKLNLKLGCIVMLLRNLSMTDELRNGRRLVVKNIQNRPQWEILLEDMKGENVRLPRITLDTREDLDMPFVLKRTQFPGR
ncbi:hypothetical protein TNCV_2339581 [Trichonephila clavipes]|nr:hypothetical protein TNCV_2339581 [Trichonephila clavipes]